MRILVISDIHGNLAALEAIRERYDICLNLGDIVEYGPEPAACIEWVRAHVQHSVRGNHDHCSAQNVDLLANAGFRYLTMATRQPTRKQLNDEQRRFLVQLPMSKLLTIDGRVYMLVHASPRDPLDEYVPNERTAWEVRIDSLPAETLCVGHTHQQFRYEIHGVNVINPGSVGLARDGIPQVRYAVIEDGKVELKQIEYDINKTVDAVQSWDIPPLAKDKLVYVYRHGKLPV